VVLVGHEIPTATRSGGSTCGRSAGATTILNPAPAAGWTGRPFGLADVLTPNEGELVVLGGAGARSTTTLVSLGAAGASLRTADGDEAIPAMRVEAVDTVGAGDTLNGALAGGLADGLALADAARRAVAAASLAVTRAGAREGMPTTAELDAALTV
jgi:ribokinase